MANTLTNLIPDIYQSLDVVSRELTGFIPAVTVDASVNRVAVGQTLRSPVSPAASATDITPAVTPPDDGNQTFTNKTITISKSRRVPVRWNGEEISGINSGVGYRNLLQAQFVQAMRTLINEMEADLAGLYVAASRAYGTAGTAPFGSTPKLADAANVMKILKDNGAPESDLHLIINTAAGVNLRSLTQLVNVNESGSDATLRRGELLNVFGLHIRESAQVKAHTKGAGTGYDFVMTGEAIGQTTLTLEGGTVNTTGIKAGDVITHAGDTANKYIVTTGTTSTSGDIVIAAPGLLIAGVDANELTVGDSYTANLAFARSAIVLASRAPALPEGGDSADDRTMITDPVTGLSFEVSMYRQYRQVQYEIAAAWGVACFKPEHTAILLG